MDWLNSSINPCFYVFNYFHLGWNEKIAHRKPQSWGVSVDNKNLHWIFEININIKYWIIIKNSSNPNFEPSNLKCQIWPSTPHSLVGKHNLC